MSIESNEVTKFLGYVSARIISANPPTGREDVLWAQPKGELNGKKYYWFFLWDGVDWVRLFTGAGPSGNGNYDTVLPDGTVMPEDVGGLSAGTLVENLRGLSFIELFDRMLFPPSEVVYIAPQATLSANGQRVVEVGQAIAISFNASFIQNDAGAVTAYELFKDALSITQQETFTDSGVVLMTPGTISYQGHYDYGQGPIKNDSHGNPHPLGRIPSGDIYTDQEQFQWVYPYYYGMSQSNSGIDVSSGTKGLVVIGNSLTVSFPALGPGFYWLAVPTGTTVFSRYYITEISKGPIGAGNAWEPAVSIVVSDGNFSNVAYDLYITGYPTQFNLPVKFEQ